MPDFSAVTVVIPSLDPDERLLNIIRDVRAQGFQDILLVDDGSAPDHQQYFEAAAEEFSCPVLHHGENRGKGAALKTAFRWLLSNRPDIAGCVTVDGDGQHHAEDIAACTAQMLADPEPALHLGVRDFYSRKVPLRSRFGNICTAFVFRTFCGLHITDTQTGLRVFPRGILPQMLEISGERFEYETNMLLMCKKFGIPIRQHTIRTIYSENDYSTHFHPVRDSIRIYGIILKFFPASIPSFALDNLLFNILNPLLKKHRCRQHLLWSTLLSKAVSGAFHHKLSRGSASRSDRSTKTAAARNAVIRLLQCALSFGAVSLLSRPFRNKTKAQGFIKAAADTVIGALGYRVRQHFDIRGQKRK